jgi:hypothetical protein
MSRCVRFLVAVPIAVAIAVPSSLSVFDGSLPGHTSHRLPHPQRHLPTVLKARVVDAASARLASRNTRETQSRAAKRSAPSSSRLSNPGQSPGNPGLHRVFRPLRC